MCCFRGGISIKEASKMDEMRADMGGAACVIATILAASMLNLKINIKGCLYILSFNFLYSVNPLPEM